MDKQYNPQQIEKDIYRLWEKGGYFNPDKIKPRRKEKFSMALPPPNVTGSLHMGHALNTVVSDILIRWKRMLGFKTLWIPGTDHAGIATQNVVEKKLKKEGKTRFDLGRENFLKEVWAWKEEYGGIILGQLKKIGASCDWSRARFTMDEQYSRAVFESFLHYYKNGWVYRGERVVNWCPRCQTSLSDLELEHKENKSSLWYIKYPLAGENNKFITVATTRPETMLGDTAVAVNPNDKRYKDLVGQKVLLPLVNREIPIVADAAIDSAFGTGAVKVTPAHDMDDYLIGQRHGLEMVSVIDEKGRMKNTPEKYQGLKVAEARKKVIADLEKTGLMEKIEDHIHKVPKCYRCDTTVELIPSLQWFVKMAELAKAAIEPVAKGEIKFHPQRWAEVYLNWLRDTRDWCISRQIWWGHRLPVWFCKKEKEKYAVSIERPIKCPICGNCGMKQSEDVFDTWFSSALWPFAILGWPDKTDDLDNYYPTNVLSTARDIINLWVARMVFSGVSLVKKIPFTDVLIHATVITKDGKRMSKSLGTGINPIEMVDKYGADATRFGLAWQASELQDMRFGESDILAGKKFCNKLWNAARFVLLLIGENRFDAKKIPATKTEADKSILAELEKTVKETGQYLEQYRFDQALQGIYHFFWHRFCDKYIEQAKVQIREATGEAAVQPTKEILIYVLLNSLKLLHPFIPFATEKIYQLLPMEEKGALIVENWPE